MFRVDGQKTREPGGKYRAPPPDRARSVPPVMAWAFLQAPGRTGPPHHEEIRR
jgi:hypothetical protein